MKSAITIDPPDTSGVEAEQSVIVSRAREITVQDRESHELALRFLAQIGRARGQVVDLFAEPKRAAHSAHRAICAAERKLLDPLDTARSTLQRKALTWEAEARRAAEEERRRLQAEAERAEQARILADAVAAEEAGDHDEAEAILDEEVVVPVVAVAPELAKVTGVTSRSTWRAEVHDLHALVCYVARHPEWLGVLAPNMTALNALARSQKDRLAMPGVCAVEERGMAVGRA